MKSGERFPVVVSFGRAWGCKSACAAVGEPGPNAWVVLGGARPSPPCLTGGHWKGKVLLFALQYEEELGMLFPNSFFPLKLLLNFSLL